MNDRTAPGVSFSRRVIAWQRKFGRHDLPWQGSRDPYRVWVSEIMLQQTQVATVIPYFEQFVREFPDVSTLADASLERVMQLWSGLGYYSRARNLHRCAQEVITRFGGVFPRNATDLETLPGIGRSTAAAIAALAFGIPAAILDGNVKRVIARHFGIAGYPGVAAVQKQLWEVAEREIPQHDIEPYTQGLMDLGAMICSRSKPNCSSCPVNTSCMAHNEGRIAQIPASKPQSPVPQRFALLLMISRGDEILLSKRPPTGIWGGLWSLPEWSLEAAEFAAGQCNEQTQENVARWVEEQGLMIESRSVLASFEHRFTHFRLGIMPMHLQVSRAANLRNRVTEPALVEPALVWMPAADIAGAALPKPVKLLLLEQMVRR